MRVDDVRHPGRSPPDENGVLRRQRPEQADCEDQPQRRKCQPHPVEKGIAETVKRAKKIVERAAGLVEQQRVANLSWLQPTDVADHKRLDQPCYCLMIPFRIARLLVRHTPGPK